MLGTMMHHPVVTGNQKLGGNLYCACIGNHSLGRLIQPQQYIDRDRPRDKRITVVTGDTLWIVRQEFGLHITVDEKVATQGRNRYSPAAILTH
jgi:hypothetical protein